MMTVPCNLRCCWRSFCSPSACPAFWCGAISLFMLMSIEIMINAAALAFVAAGSRWGQADGQVMFLFVLTLAAAEITVGLARSCRIRHRFRTLDSDAAN